MNQLRPLVIFIVVVAALAYIGGIIYAGIESLQSDTKPPLPELVTQTITVIGGALATHFGAIFGISQLDGGSPRPIPSPLNVKAWAAVRPLRQDEPPQPTLNFLQVIAAYLYIVSLVGAVVFWLLDEFSSESADILRNMSFTFVGVIGGVVAVILNVRNP